jgi:3-isopropylmalate dehydrogenase
LIPGRPYRIGVIPGDGVGPEVVAEGLKVLDAVGVAYDRSTYDWGAERYLRTGETLPDGVIEELRGLDAIYLGAVGHPSVAPGVLERGILLRIRFELDQYLNLRPIRLYAGVESRVRGVEPEDVDLLVVRENVEGLYVGAGWFLGNGTPEEVAVQESVNTRRGVERVVRYAFGLAQKRRRRLTLVHKTNVLNYAGDLWQRTVDDVAAEHPDVETTYSHVDAFCVLLLEDPGRFDVVVTDNMFGDIVTDLGAVLQGGMGVAASGNVNPDGVSMFEPIAGTAPAWVGTGGINPIAAIAAVGMLLTALGEDEAAGRVEAGIRFAVPKMASQLAGQMGYSTFEVGDLVVEGARHD